MNDEQWELLIGRISRGRCTPFLGAGISIGKVPGGARIAREWAQQYQFPLMERDDLARVAQFLAIKMGDFVRPKEMLLESYFQNLPPLDVSADDPHNILATLPIPIFLTTNYDDYMLQALRLRPDKKPILRVCRWNSVIELPSSADELAEPTAESPLVFHLHGHRSEAESLVLTEDDYLDFLVSHAENPDRLIPLRIQRALANTTLLFIGYRISDWNFKVIFRSLTRYLQNSISKVHISVQLNPVGDGATPEQRERAREYLDRYFLNQQISVYWGTAQEFLGELKTRWAMHETKVKASAAPICAQT